MKALATLIGFVLAGPALAHAGVLTGTVTDAATKQPVADVIVTATSPALMGEQVVVTDGTGLYRIPQLPPGEYTLRLEREGYKPYSRAGIPLPADTTRRINAELLPEPLTAEEIVVVGRAPVVDVGGALQGIARSFESLAQGSPGSRNEDAPPAKARWGTGSQSRPPFRYSVTGPGGTTTLQWLPGQPLSTVNGKPFQDMYFKNYGVNPTIDTEEEPFSTFSVDVDTASYSLARSYLERGAMPEEDGVRVEEFINSFDYGYEPSPTEPFSVHVEAFPSPHRKGYHVLHLGLRGKDVRPAERKPARLVFAIDISGSMATENRLGLVKQALQLLVDQLDERDAVAIVVYGSEALTVIDLTPATEKARLLSAIASLAPGGSTNAQAGLELAYELASRHFQPGAINRVILCSDGVANNGVTSADGIWDRVKGQAQKGVTLSTVGFGMGNYNDVLMERLAQVGNGNYSYVDRLEEAERIFVQNLTGTLQVVAKDVKIQLELDPKTVFRYRLLGYENRRLEKEQFADDRVDAGEVGAGHRVTAMYEVKLTSPARDLGTLRIRYKDPDGSSSRLLEKKLPATIVRPAYAQASSPARLSFVAATFAEKLRGSYWVRAVTYDRLLALWEEIPPPLRDRPDVLELRTLISRAKLLDKRKDRFEEVAPVARMDFDRVPVMP